MKANELRIGNLVKATNPRHSETYLTVESISYDSINLDFRTYNLSEIEPIPLTEEWLLKFGFYCKEKDSANYDASYRIDIYSDNGITIVLYTDHRAVYRAVSYAVLPGLFTVTCEHVHQLQNLYFSLKSEELTLKEVTKAN